MLVVVYVADHVVFFAMLPDGFTNEVMRHAMMMLHVTIVMVMSMIVMVVFFGGRGLRRC